MYQQESSVKLHQKEKQTCQHKGKKNQHSYGETYRKNIGSDTQVTEQPPFAPFNPEDQFKYFTFHPNYGGWFITSQHAMKRTAKGTSSFKVHVKIHRRQPQPRSLKWNFLRNQTFLQANYMCQQGKPNPLNHKSRKEGIPLIHTLTSTTG